MKIACYARTSTTDQRPAAQLDRLTEYCARRGDEAVPFVDQCSGAQARRPALDALLEAVRRREVDLVATLRLDRLARSVSHLTGLVSEFEAHGVPFVVLDQGGVETCSATGKLLFHVLASLAEFERSLIRERVADGMAHARRKGKHLGRPRRLDRSARQRLHRLRARGWSLRRLAAALQCSLGTVSRELRRA